MNKPIVVALNGSGGVGKTTFAKYCGTVCKAYNFSSVENIKNAAIFLGCDIQDKSDKTRAFLSDLTRLADEYFDYRKFFIKGRLNYLKTSDALQIPDVVLIDIREQELINWLKEEYNAITLIVRNSRVNEIKSNSSDANVGGINYDYEIANDGTLDDLNRKAGEFIKTIIT